jgi:hypothetical protein
MPHSHQHGWAPQEIGLFVDQYLKAGMPLPSIAKPKLTDGKAHARVRSKTDLVSAELHYSTGSPPINKLDWETRPANLDKRQVISCPAPDDAAIWFLTVTDERDAVVSSELVFAREF